MPWRLIGFIVVFVVFVVFIAFNLDNKCDINFGFKTFTAVPVFLTVFSSFVAGMFCALLFVIGVRTKRKAAGSAGAKSKKEKKGGESSPGAEAGSFPDGGPYGIN